ncbi:MAG: 50S ribosomal protein L11 methyltransferase [Vicinamibacterales bacterium]
MKFPALDVRGADSDFVLALVDDFSPTAVEELADGISIFFTTPARRDDARAAVSAAMPDALLSTREVDDEDWAKRSQENLTPIVVGRLTVTPPWCVDDRHTSTRDPEETPQLRVVILPSMGFGTGHHATTRLCLEALQMLPLAGARVLDVGTGSGVLAIAAAKLGASSALGIDFDADAIANARENLDLNRDVHGVAFEVVDVRDAALPTTDIVLANLTGAVLVQTARLLEGAVADEGTLVVSGLQPHEREDVVTAFSDGRILWEKEEANWMSIAFNFPRVHTV